VTPFIAPVDFLVVAPLPEERAALLSLLEGNMKLPPSEADIRVYYGARVGGLFPDGTEVSYTVVVTSPNNMGHTEAANVTGDGVRRWDPRYVVLVGIAGGIGDEVRLGDVLISDQIVDYELQKVRPGGPGIRWQVHRADPRLVAAAQHFHEPGWARAVAESRPAGGDPFVHFGPICTGNKVLADGTLAEQYRDVWEKLIGVEMEAGGAASATFQAAVAPGFFMVRGVSDLANADKDAGPTRDWRSYACKIAAAYLVALIRSGPVPARPVQLGTAAAAPDGRTELARLGIQYSAAAFLESVREGDRRAVDAFLHAGMSPDTENGYGRSALAEAVAAGHLHIVISLLRKGANADVPDQSGNSVLISAMRSNKAEIAVALAHHSAGAKQEPTPPLHVAILKGYMEIVRALLDKGALAKESREEIAWILGQAAAEGHVEIVGLLLDTGADPSGEDRFGRTPLLAAMEHRRPDIVRALLARGADPNRGKGDLFGKRFGTPLMVAAASHDTDILDALLKFGANVNAKSTNDITALMVAANLGDERQVERLLAAGADTNAKNGQGKTARMLAERRGHPRIVERLIRAERESD
jgi:ankyrin repeat protein/nucleoside phosphorylase